MVRTLRRACPSCGKAGFYVEGRRRTSCFYCGHDIVQPAGRGAVLVDFRCPACRVVSEVEDTATLVRCPGCKAGFGWAHSPDFAALGVRDVVSRARAVRLAEQRGRGAIESATLYFAPSWLFHAVEMGWVLGNEKLADPGSLRKRGVDPARDAPAREIVAPVGGKLEYTRKETHRAVRELLPDPVLEPFGWKPLARHASGAVLAPFDALEVEPGARVLAPQWSRDLALEECSRRAQARELVDERSLYRFFEHRVLLRTAVTLVYHPFWVLFFEPPDVPGRESIPRDWMVIDAVDGQVTREPLAGGPALFRAATVELPSRAMTPVRLACPACRDDLGALEPATFQTIVSCPRCRACLELSNRGLEPVEARYVAPVAADAGEGEELVYVPVWRYRVKVRLERKELASRAQWKRFMRSGEPSPDPNESKRSIVFYSVAAGAARTARLDALSLALTRLQPDLAFAVPRDASRVLPAAFRAVDARTLAFPTYVALYRDLTLKSIDALKRTEVLCDQPELIFYPCIARRNEVHDPRLGVTLQLGGG